MTHNQPGGKLRFRRFLRWRGRWYAGAAVVGVAALIVGLVAPTGGAAELPKPVTAGLLATPQVNGIVFSVAIVGDTAYVGGRFSKARPAGVSPGGAGEVTRNNVLAFKVSTGELLSWSPSVTGTEYSSPTDPGPYCRSTGTQRWVCDTVFRVKASPDGSRIYIGGDFDKVNGTKRSKIAAFTTSNGALVTGFAPAVNSRVRGISVTDNAVFIGGAFTTVNGVPRSKLAELNTSGVVQPWAPSADGEVFSVLAAPATGRVLMGGNFNHINGAAHRGIMGVNYSDGKNAPWSWSPPSGYEVMTDIETDNAGFAYFGAYDSGGGARRAEGRGAVRISDGVSKWNDGCYGDTQSVAVANGVVYGASHTHSCPALNEIPENGSIDYQRLTAESTVTNGGAPASGNFVRQGDPVPALLPWFPNTNGGPAENYFKNGPWAMAANDNYVIAGGEFTTVSGIPRQGLARFAARGVAGAKNDGPQQAGFKTPSVFRFGNSVRVGWTATWDKQNYPVRYELLRVGTAAPINTQTVESRYWKLPSMSFTDPNAPAGAQYRVRAIDADNAAISTPTSSGV